MLRVLTIDGGGIRGIIPAMLLNWLEKQTGKPVHQMFDLIAGTSTGGILALGFTRPGPSGLPLTAAELIELYTKHGERIFPKKFLGGSLLRAILDDEKYEATGLESVLRLYFGDSRLRECLTPVLVTAYDTYLRSPLFFDSDKARSNDEYNFLMRDVARATSAAPTYFEAHRLPAAAPTDLNGSYSLIDGGIFANNPAMCAYARAARLRPAEAPGMLLVSLGTGGHTRRYRWEQVKDWSAAQWMRPVLSMMMDGVSDTVDFQMKQLLPAERYFRIDLELNAVNDDFDDASARNIQDIKAAASDLITRENATLRRIADALTAPAKPIKVARRRKKVAR